MNFEITAEQDGGFDKIQQAMVEAAEQLCGTIIGESGRPLIEETPAQTRLARALTHVWASRMIGYRAPWASIEKKANHAADETFDEDVMGFCRHLAQQNAEMVGASKITIELAADLPAHQAASVERLVNSSLMLGNDCRELMVSHVASIGAKKG